MDFIPHPRLWKPYRKLERFKAHVLRMTRRHHLTVTGSWEPESQLWKPQRLVRKEDLPLPGGGNPRQCLPWFWNQIASKRGDLGVTLPPTKQAELSDVIWNVWDTAAQVRAAGLKSDCCSITWEPFQNTDFWASSQTNQSLSVRPKNLHLEMVLGWFWYTWLSFWNPCSRR